ncbi:MAG: aminotransferase class III-fold pyridoxal phosphate-dependent enzyme, partial [Comamonadaceae bacterium]
SWKSTSCSRTSFTPARPSNSRSSAILNRACDAGLLLSVTADSVIRLVPPLILSIAETDEIVAILAPIVKAFLAEPKP